MPLTNFGAILNFAETIEREDMEFYTRMAAATADHDSRNLCETFAGEGKKNIALIQRTRRENVTEMILEPIRDFERGPYQAPAGGETGDDPAALRATAIAREQRAAGYYSDAAAKIRALPEVARALKMLAKKRTRRLDPLQKTD